jgi:hypothetical protein
MIIQMVKDAVKESERITALRQAEQKVEQEITIT